MTDLTNRFINAKRALFDKLYSSLNERQREAVATVNGPLLVLAGAGSGKTTVLVKRIAHIIRYGNAYYSEKIPYGLSERDVEELERSISLPDGEIETLLEKYADNPCPPWAMLSITFTNKAANEMKERLEKSLGENGATEIWAGTFHSVCVRILRRHGEAVGLPRSFTIYDSDDSKKVIAEATKELNIDDKTFPAKSVMNTISRAKDKLISAKEFAETAGKDYRLSQISKIYSLYEEKLSSANAVDFDDIIVKTVRLLSDFDDVRSYYQNKFRYVSIDEYQDTNRAQFVLSVLLSGERKNIMVVGDDDQSIYRFRGATIENILSFDKIYKEAKVVKLEQNYRSTKTILDAANAVIENNEGRKGKRLWTDKVGGGKISLTQLNNQNDEATYIAEKILQIIRRENRPFKDFAVLYRMNAQSNAIEKVFARSGITYRVLGGTRFYDRKEVKDILAYLSLVNNPSDDLRLKRIINEPKRKIGNSTVEAISDIAAVEKTSLLSVIERASEYTALQKMASRLSDFALLISDLRVIAQTKPLSELFRKTIELSGYSDMLAALGDEGKERLENVNELVSNAIEYEENNENATLSGFLEEVALVADIDNYDKDADAVVLMTMHSAKGLEFPVVFLPGMENGIFPSLTNMTEHEEMEEERRIAYVAITRAREKLFITHTKERIFYGQTQYNPLSQFAKEIPDSLLDLSDSPQKRGMPRDARFDVNRLNRDMLGGFSSKLFQKTQAPKPSQIKTSTPVEMFAVGTTVEHMTFGKGTVLSVTPCGADALYEVAFDTVGTKKMMAKFAKLKKVE